MFDQYERENSSSNFLYVSIALVILVGAYACYAFYRNSLFDPNTGCRLAGESDSIVIFIDKTDSYPVGVVEKIDEIVTKIILQSNRGAEITLYTIDDEDIYGRAPIFQGCNPGTREKHNPLISNQKKMQENFEDSFRNPFRSLLEEILVESEHEKSPIFEDLISLQGFDGGSDRRVVVFSDMMQNSNLASIYSQKGKEFMQSLLSYDLSSLDEVEIDFYIIPRKKLKNKQLDMINTYIPAVFNKNQIKVIRIQ